MSRHEAIAAIEAHLPMLNASQVETLAEIVRSMAEPIRSLSDRERQLLDRSREDFEAGRTVTLEESHARTDALFARHRSAKT